MIICINNSSFSFFQIIFIFILRSLILGSVLYIQLIKTDQIVSHSFISAGSDHQVC